MKKAFIAIVVMLVASAAVSATAEVPKDYVAQLRSQIQADETTIVASGMNFINEDASKTFWPIYRKYVSERDSLVDQRLRLIKDYADNYQNMNNATAKKLVDRAYSLDEDARKLQKKYVSKMEKELSPIVAARFMQVDNQINLVKRLNLAANLPLINEAPMPAKAAG